MAYAPPRSGIGSSLTHYCVLDHLVGVRIGRHANCNPTGSVRALISRRRFSDKMSEAKRLSQITCTFSNYLLVAKALKSLIENSHG